MRTSSIFCLALIVLSALCWNSVQAEDGSFEEDRSRALNFLRRTIFHPTRTKCEEQKREAKEDYEERCEPSNPIYRNQNAKRNCPDLNTWNEFVNYEIGDGLGTLDDLKPNIKLPKLPRIPTADEVGNRVYDRVTGAEDANNFLKRTFFHPGSTKCEEQKREAREDYEERCEPSMPLLRNTGTNRFCPDINTWKEFDQYEIGNGYDPVHPGSGNPLQYDTIDREGDRRHRPPPFVPERSDDHPH